MRKLIIFSLLFITIFCFSQNTTNDLLKEANAALAKSNELLLQMQNKITTLTAEVNKYKMLLEEASKKNLDTAAQFEMYKNLLSDVEEALGKNNDLLLSLNELIEKNKTSIKILTDERDKYKTLLEEADIALEKNTDLLKQLQTRITSDQNEIDNLRKQLATSTTYIENIYSNTISIFVGGPLWSINALYQFKIPKAPITLLAGGSYTIPTTFLGYLGVGFNF